MDTNPKQFVENSLSKETSYISNRDEIGRDDDEPLSVRQFSITIFGFFLAIMTFLLPAISVLLDRPLLLKNGVNSNIIIDKNGY
tara:strand:+ start:273 stop:524 length:252 start_codon:yes stop_codon:yes gene_type:complete